MASIRQINEHEGPEISSSPPCSPRETETMTKMEELELQLKLTNLSIESKSKQEQKRKVQGEENEVKSKAGLSKTYTPNKHESNPNGEHPDSSIVIFDLETTGFGYDSDITQLSAIYKDQEYNQYVLPKKEITTGASKVTKITKHSGHLYYKGKLVESTDIGTALAQFINWLPNRCILVAHNGKSFDANILTHKLLQFNDIFSRLDAKLGHFTDTLHLFRYLFPERRYYNQECLVHDLLGEECTDSHNALVDVRMLKCLFEKYAYKQPLDSYSFDLKSVVKRLQKKDRLSTLRPLLERNVITDYMAQKLADSGISFEDLKLAHSRGGIDEVKNILSAKTQEGKPRVTHDKQILTKIASFIDEVRSKES